MPQPSSRTCSVDGCDGKHRARGWCYKHYLRWKRHGDPLAVQAFYGSTVDRFWHYTDQRADGHWIWTGPGNNPANPARDYGVIYVSELGRTMLAHRYAWTLLRGPIPPDQEPDHLCRIVRCVNPDCLEPVPHRTNVTRGKSPAAEHARRTDCGVCGGPYSVRRDGRRFCRACARNSTAAAAARRRSGVGTGGVQRARTHCTRGHEYTEDNTYRHPKTGNRDCRRCRRIRSEQSRQRQRAS